MDNMKREDLVKACEEKFAEYRNYRPYRPLYFIDEKGLWNYDFFDHFTVDVLRSLLECEHNNIIFCGDSRVLNKENKAYLCKLKDRGDETFIFTGVKHYVDSDKKYKYQCINGDGRWVFVSEEDIIPEAKPAL